MTIKKTMKVKQTGDPTVAAPAADVPAAGGATIADRFKLDMPDSNEKKTSSGGPATTVAVVAGLLALAVVGILAYVLWQHWQFLMPA